MSIKHHFAVFDNNTPISDLLDEVSLHITFHSTSAFDAAINGVPTIFIDMLKPFSPNEMFFNQYEYPCEDLVINNTYDLKEILLDFENKDIFEKIAVTSMNGLKSFIMILMNKYLENFLLKNIN